MPWMRGSRTSHRRNHRHKSLFALGEPPSREGHLSRTFSPTDFMFVKNLTQLIADFQDIGDRLAFVTKSEKSRNEEQQRDRLLELADAQAITVKKLRELVGLAAPIVESKG